MDSENGREPQTASNQRELLHTAVHEGYFKVPREVSLVELAAQHNISDQEFSERLRHEIDKLVRETSLEE